MASQAARSTVPSLEEQVGAEEWDVRVQLAAAYRLVHRYGWATTLIFNHISARVRGPEHHFLLNPFGLAYDEVTASNLVKIDLDGALVGESDYGINKAGFLIHGAIHAARPDIDCVIHTHTEAGMAISGIEEGLHRHVRAPSTAWTNPSGIGNKGLVFV